MYVTREAKANSPPAYAVLIAALLAILSLSAAAATARAQQTGGGGGGDDDGAAIESNYYTDEADAGFFDFGDDEFGDATALGDDDFGDAGFGNDGFGDDNGLVDVDEDTFNFDAEYGQDYDEQLVSDETEYEYQQDANVYETDEAWFEDWFGDEG